ARVVCSALWFHPLAWLAMRKLALEAEKSCDDAVILTSDAAEYADQLVSLAQRLASASKAPALGMAYRANLARRVEAVLSSGLKRGRAGASAVGLAATAAIVLALAISPLSVTAAPQADDPSTGVLSITTALVQEDVYVTDRTGKDVEGLTAADFVVTEDSRQRALSFFTFEK